MPVRLLLKATHADKPFLEASWFTGTAGFCTLAAVAISLFQVREQPGLALWGVVRSTPPDLEPGRLHAHRYASTSGTTQSPRSRWVPDSGAGRNPGCNPNHAIPSCPPYSATYCASSSWCPFMACRPGWPSDTGSTPFTLTHLVTGRCCWYSAAHCSLHTWLTPASFVCWHSRVGLQL